MLKYKESLYKMYFIMWVALKIILKNYDLMFNSRSVRGAKNTTTSPSCGLSHIGDKTFNTVLSGAQEAASVSGLL